MRRGVKVDSEGNVQSKRNANSKGEDEEPLQRFFARIYSFTYEAHYYRLPRPLLFLLNSEGQPIGGSRESEADEEAAISSLGPARADQLKQARAARQKGAKGSSAKTTASAGGGGAHQSLAFSAHRFSAKYTGVEARDWDFSSDIRVWAVDRKDLTVCLDIEIANYQEILLDSMITSDRPEEERAARSRGDIISRGAGSFRGDMIGPHQNKFR